MLAAPAPATRKSRRSRKSQRGQAMVEYGIINYILLMALVCLATAPIFKGPTPQAGIVQKRNVIEMMLEAYQHYYDSYYLVLSMPYP